MRTQGEVRTVEEKLKGFAFALYFLLYLLKRY